MKKNQNKCGFSLAEVLVALLLGGVAVAGMTQFFLSQLYQYYLITNSNGLNYDLRTATKYLEKDIRNSLEFYALANIASARTFTNPASAPGYGECVLIVLEVGRVDGGRGCVYYRAPTGRAKNGRTIYSLYRAICTFRTNSTPVIDETNALMVAEDCSSILKNNTAMFIAHPRFTFAGARRGLFMGAKFLRGSGKDKNNNNLATTFCQLCFYSRNPAFK